MNCTSDKKELPVEFKDSKLHLIEFLEKKIYLPNDFEKSTIETLIELIKNSADQNKLSEFALQRLNNFKKVAETAKIFVKNNNYKNNITFQPGNYVELTKEAVEIYVNLLENHLFTQSESYEIERKRLESKFLRYGISQIVKVKYLQTFKEEKIYLTQYLVTYKSTTFGIVISSVTDNDYQYILKNFRK